MDRPTQRLDPEDADGIADSATRHLELPEDRPEHICPKCHGEMIWGAASGSDSYVSKVRIFRRKEASRWSGPNFGSTPCAVLVCIICGFVEWYATQPKNLLPDK
jgi:hypothetical protein